MCGINGRFNLDGQPVDPADIASMRDEMTHRGPDESGLFVDGAIGLGHRRLSIIDLSTGRQPIANEDGSVTLVFNGEIYNFRELRRDLESRGHRFRTSSDTEVIVHLYEELGSECVHRLRGMFAFALWDENTRTLLLARDRLGVKPLYYADTGGSLLFASEIKSILRTPGFAAELDPLGLRRYLAYRRVYGEATMFRGIRPIPAGCYIVATAAGAKLHRYWDVPESADAPSSEAELLRLLEESVELRMISDVPIGAFLSGGLDSSVIATIMARHTDRVRTFSVGFVPSSESELGWAKKVAEHIGAEHHEFVQSADDFYQLLPKLVWHHDEPLTFPASIPLYLLSRESKRIATVMLAGEGADELLGGYDNNVRTARLAAVAARMPGAVRRGLPRLPLPARFAHIASRLACDRDELVLGAFRAQESAGLTSASRVPLPDGRSDDEALMAETGVTSRSGTFLDRLLYFQLKTYLDALLMKQDKMSMAASIETRVPYLDHRLVELAFSLPDRAKIRGKTGKYLLKKAATTLIPADIVHRRKQGFPVPIRQWLRKPGNPFVEILLDPQSRRDGLLDARFVEQHVRRFQSGENLESSLWVMLNLELWRRSFLAADAAGATASRADAAAG